MATAASYGTLSISDLLRVNNTPIIDFGVLDVYQAIREYLAAYNMLLQEQLGNFVEKTTERVAAVTGPTSMQAVFTDEFGVADPQKVSGPSIMGFPLRKWDVSLQWTEQWFMNHTPQELATQAQDATVADLQKLQYAIRVALFTPTNRTSVDRLRDNMTIPVKALANADGFPIPPSPNGFTFNAATHTHYMGTAGASLAAADIDSLLRNVLEHFNGGKIVLYVSQDVESSMTALQAAGNLPAYAKMVYTRQVAPITQLYTEGPLVESQPFNRITGTYRDAEVWVKPWMPSGTLFVFMVGGGRKPIAMRVRATLDASGRYAAAAGGDNGDFRMVFESMEHPLQCQAWSREVGFGVQDRVSAAVMTVGSPTYTTPTLVASQGTYMV